MPLPPWAIWGLVSAGSSILQSWTAPKTSYPEQRETAEEKWFQSRVDMGAALVKRRNTASEMAATVMQRAPAYFQNYHFDAKMNEIKSTLPANSTHANNIAILQTAKMYGDYTEETSEIQTRDISPKVDVLGRKEGQPGITIEKTDKGKKERFNVLGQRLPDDEDEHVKEKVRGVSFTSPELVEQKKVEKKEEEKRSK